MGKQTERTWDLVNDAVRRFEQAWKAAPNPTFPDLPLPETAVRQKVLIELIKVDQEHRWRVGDRKKIEDYLGDWPEFNGKPDVLKELLEAECLTREATTDVFEQK